MMKRSLPPNALGLLLAAAALAVLVVSAPASAETLAGTRVALDPPVGFIVETQFPGYRHVETGATIMVTEVSGPIERLLAGLTKSALAGRGMTLLESSDVNLGEHGAQFLRVTQAAAGITYEKWLLVFGSASDSVFVVATFPQSEAKSLREPMRQAVMSARWAPGMHVDRLDGLPFQVTESAALKISRRMSNLVLLTEGGADGVVAPEDPLLIVGASISEVDTSDLAAFAKVRLKQIEQVNSLSGVKGTKVTVDGLPGYELTADAVDRKSGTPIRVYQLLVADGSRYFIAQGFVGVKRAGTFVPQFREVAGSIRQVR